MIQTSIRKYSVRNGMTQVVLSWSAMARAFRLRRILARDRLDPWILKKRMYYSQSWFWEPPAITRWFFTGACVQGINCVHGMAYHLNAFGGRARAGHENDAVTWCRARTPDQKAITSE